MSNTPKIHFRGDWQENLGPVEKLRQMREISLWYWNDVVTREAAGAQSADTSADITEENHPAESTTHQHDQYTWVWEMWNLFSEIWRQADGSSRSPSRSVGSCPVVCWGENITANERNKINMFITNDWFYKWFDTNSLEKVE